MDPVRRAATRWAATRPGSACRRTSSTPPPSARQRRWPAAMTTLSTHDTKRSEDVRARLAVLAELPGEWADGGRAGGARTAPLPDPSLAHLLWQTVAGCVADRARAAAGVRAEGGARGGDVDLAGSDPDEAFEAALRRDGRRGLRRPGADARTSPTFAAAHHAARLVQLAGPEAGAADHARACPDVYQGTELWDHSLVDPDNRRPVDFGAAPRRCWPGLDAGWLPPVDAVGRGEAAGHQPGAAAAPAAAGAVRRRTGRCSPTAGRPSTCWPSTAAAWSRWPPGCRSACRGAAAGTTPRCRSTATAGRDVLTGTSYGGEPAAVRRAAAHATRSPCWSGRVHDRFRGVGAGRRRVAAAGRRRRITRWSAARTAGGGGRAGGRPRHRLRLPAGGRRQRRYPTRARAGSLTGCTAPAGCTTTRPSRWTDSAWTGRQLPGSVLYELHVGTFTAGGHLRRRHRAARPPGRPGRRPGRAAAGQRLQRRAQLGVRRGLLVRAARGVRRPGRPEALRRRRATARARRGARRRLQPLRAVAGRTRRCSGPTCAERPATRGARSVNLDGPHSDEVRRYIIDNALMWLRDYHVDGLRLDAVHALVDHARGPPAGGAGRRGGGAVDPPGPAAVADRRVRPQRPAADHPARGRRVRPARRSGTTTCTTRCTRCSPASGRATTATSARWTAWPTVLTGAFFHAGTWSSFRGRRARPAGRPAPHARAPVRRVPAEPRPDRQPRDRRPALRVALAAACSRSAPRCC